MWLSCILQCSDSCALFLFVYREHMSRSRMYPSLQKSLVQCRIHFPALHQHLQSWARQKIMKIDWRLMQMTPRTPWMYPSDRHFRRCSFHVGYTACTVMHCNSVRSVDHFRRGTGAWCWCHRWQLSRGMQWDIHLDQLLSYSMRKFRKV